MPNFNGAIVMHTMQLLKTPATLREIVMTIAKNTDLSQDELMKPVKQTLDVGHRLGFLQKLNGRYFLVPMTFDTLMNEMKSLGQPARRSDMPDKLESKPKAEKKPTKQQVKQLDPLKNVQEQSQSLPDGESTTTLKPSQSANLKLDALMLRKPKRSQLPIN